MSSNKKKSTGQFKQYNPHTRPLSEREETWTSGFYRVVSIDPGKVNFALRIEKRDAYDGTKVTTEQFVRKNFDKSTNDGIDHTFDLITSFLDENLILLYNSHYVIIEKQLSRNYQSLRISQHVLSYVLINLRNAPYLPFILELESAVKGKVLSAPKGQDIKKWSEEKAMEILRQRGDQESIKKILHQKGSKGQKKGDDLADTVVQIEALFTMLELPTALSS